MWKVHIALCTFSFRPANGNEKLHRFTRKYNFDKFLSSTAAHICTRMCVHCTRMCMYIPLGGKLKNCRVPVRAPLLNQRFNRVRWEEKKATMKLRFLDHERLKHRAALVTFIWLRLKEMKPDREFEYTLTPMFYLSSIPSSHFVEEFSCDFWRNRRIKIRHDFNKSLFVWKSFHRIIGSTHFAPLTYKCAK